MEYCSVLGTRRLTPAPLFILIGLLGFAPRAYSQTNKGSDGIAAQQPKGEPALTVETARLESDRLRRQHEDHEAAVAILDSETTSVKTELAELESPTPTALATDVALRLQQFLDLVLEPGAQPNAPIAPEKQDKLARLAEDLSRYASLRWLRQGHRRPQLRRFGRDGPPTRAEVLAEQAIASAPAEQPPVPPLPDWPNHSIKEIVTLLERVEAGQPEKIDGATVTALRQHVQAAGSALQRDVAQHIAELEKHRDAWRKADLEFAVRVLMAARTQLVGAKDATERRQAELARFLEQQSVQNRQILETNLLYLLVGMMAVVIIVITILAVISRRPLALALVEHRTVVELAGVTFLLSVVLLLASSGRIDPATTGTLLGTIAGYILGRRSGPQVASTTATDEGRLIVRADPAHPPPAQPPPAQPPPAQLHTSQRNLAAALSRLVQ
jgi:hypothetical protein